MKKLKSSLNTLILFLILLSCDSSSSTCISTGNGAWDNPTSWSCGAVPACGDSIVILAGVTITITSQQDYSGCGAAYIKMTIYGTLKFNNGNKLKLCCNSRIYVFPGGSIKPGTGGGNSNYIEICNNNEWNAGSGNYNGPGCLPAAFTGCGGALPIELADFSAFLNKQVVELSWTTFTEKNNSYFDIEKSEDALSFTPFSTVKSKAPFGNSRNILEYSETDLKPLANVSYYRLKQVDLDNTVSYSKIVSVNISKAKNLRFIIYPNPNSGEFVVDISGLENNHLLTLDLKDERGSVVYNSSFYLEDLKSGKINISPSGKLSKGIYFCTLRLEEIEYSIKVIIS